MLPFEKIPSVPSESSSLWDKEDDSYTILHTGSDGNEEESGTPIKPPLKGHHSYRAVINSKNNSNPVSKPVTPLIRDERGEVFRNESFRRTKSTSQLEG